AAGVARARLDLGEDERAPVVEDDVDLAAAAAPVPRRDARASRLRVRHGRVLAAFVEAGLDARRDRRRALRLCPAADGAGSPRDAALAHTTSDTSWSRRSSRTAPRVRER